MYKLQEKPDDCAMMNGGCDLCVPIMVTPVATLKDEHGGVSHIIIDDHCYVLMNGTEASVAPVRHWFHEAVAALQGLPADPRDLEPEIVVSVAQTDQPCEPPAQEDRRPT